MKIGIGLYGANGHQISALLADHPRAELMAVAAMERGKLPPALASNAAITVYPTLPELLRDSRVQLVSLCSPRRGDETRDAILCLEAGRHVYSEKPCALNEADLDRILAASSRTGCRFHEMAGSAFDQPYLAMREVVRSGVLGTIIHVFAQKSYPSMDWKRPQDEMVDGGLTRQAGVHGARFIEHVAGVRIRSVQTMETQLGNPQPDGQLRIASVSMMRLENGGVASLIINYLNPPTFGRWGNEHLRIFGLNGFLEATDGGAKTRLVLNDKDMGPIDPSAPSQDYFNFMVASILDKTPMPLSLEEELHPTRIVIRAKESAARWEEGGKPAGKK